MAISCGSYSIAGPASDAKAAALFFIIGAAGDDGAGEIRPTSAISCGMTSDNPSASAYAVARATATRTALEGVTGAERLLDAIDRLAATLATAEERAPLELREAERDLADARAAGQNAADPTLTDRVRATERALDAARVASRMQPADPVAALSAATEAHRLADEALLGDLDRDVTGDDHAHLDRGRTAVPRGVGQGLPQDGQHVTQELAVDRGHASLHAQPR